MKVTIAMTGKVDLNYEIKINKETQTGGFKADLQMEEPLTYEVKVEDHEALVQVYKDFGYDKFMEAFGQYMGLAIGNLAKEDC